VGDSHTGLEEEAVERVSATEGGRREERAFAPVDIRRAAVIVVAARGAVDNIQAAGNVLVEDIRRAVVYSRWLVRCVVAERSLCLRTRTVVAAEDSSRPAVAEGILGAGARRNRRHEAGRPCTAVLDSRT
jgi:hypothetical protein